MKPVLPFIALFVTAAAALLAPPTARAQSATPSLDEAQARAGLSIKPPRNPVKSSAPIVKRTHERRAVKGLELVDLDAEGASAPGTKVVEVEVVHRQDGTTEERPFVALPILFAVGTDELFDATSRANVEKMAAVLRDLIGTEQARFTIQGHTSAEGSAEENQALSDRRAVRIQALLAARDVSVPALATLGLGEECARAEDQAPESARQLDRRVLIVRMK